MNFDESFDRAQRAYDNQSDDYEDMMDSLPDCIDPREELSDAEIDEMERLFANSKR
jgi:hypothetical protein